MTAGRLLLVDDEPDIRAIAKMSLERDRRLGGDRGRLGGGGAGRRAARHAGRRAARRDDARRRRPGDVYAQLRPLLGEAVPIIFLTAKDEHERLLALGAAGVIAKPFDPISLPREVAAITAR